MSSPPPVEAATPMMRQYLAVKAQHPGAVVLFRLGDFFEAFYEDAEICARLLDLTLTSRSKEKDAIPMAGVPHHAIDGYIAKLIEHGKTVVIVDQVEDPKKAKGLVKREVTEVLTPGTFLDPSAPPRQFHYLVSLVPAGAPAGRGRGSALGLAALDVSTGELRATTVEDGDQLIDEISRLMAREVVLSESAKTDPRVERIRIELPKIALSFISEADASPEGARKSLSSRLGADELRALELILSSEALTAAGNVLRYVERSSRVKGREDQPVPGATGTPALGHVLSLRPYLPGDALILDAEARAHLELFRAAGDGGRRGSLLGAIDEAVTPMGGRLVARWLARPLVDPIAIGRRQESVALLVDSPSALDRIRSAYGRVYDLERLLGRVVLGRSTPRDLAALRASIERAPEILEAARAAADPRQKDLDGSAGSASASRLLEIASVDTLPDIAEQIGRALVDAPPAELGAEPVFRAGFDRELDELVELSRSGKNVLAEIERRERERTGIGSLKVKYNRVFGYFIEVTKANLKSVPSDYIRKQTTAGGERFYTEELKSLEEKILSADERRLERETALLAGLVRCVAGEARRIKALAEALAELDVLAAFAFLAERRGWSRPAVDAGDRIEITDGRHPVLEPLSAELGERFVPNDIAIGGEQRLLLITGPNMAGKSTIMRQTALIVILAQMGSFVPARSARIGVVDRAFTRVGASDDLSRGRSTFMVEMTETARILRSATARSLVLLDEIGRGTSTFDGLSIAWAVAEHLHDVVAAKTLFATHYHELTELCRTKPHAANFHVAVKEWNEEIVFLRKLLPGSTNRSYGVQVARLAGLPAAVIERAKLVLASLEAQALSATDLPAPARSSGPRSRARSQLSLFGPPPPREPELTGAARDVLLAIASLDVDGVTPREALEKLAAFKEQLAADGDSTGRD